MVNGCAVRAAPSCLNNNPPTLRICNFVFPYLIFAWWGDLFIFGVFSL